MNTRFSYLILIMMFLCSSCSEDIFDTVSINSSKLTLIVEDEHILTRADYGDFPATAFETGDAIGLYDFDGSSYVENNVRFTKQSDGSWACDPSYVEGIPFYEDHTYYAYFPYRATTYTPSSSGTVDAVDTKFSNFISDASNYFWQANQSTKAGFTYSNLMIAKGTVTNAETGTVKFTMAHKRGLALFNGEAFAGTTFVGNIPYTIGDNGYFLMKPDTPTSFEEDNGTYTLTAPAGITTRKKIQEKSNNYFKFTAIQDGTFTFSKAGLSYSLDNGGSWTEIAANTATPTVTAGNDILWKNNRSIDTNSGGNGIGKFSATGQFTVSGNIMSLVHGDNFANKTSLVPYQFYQLFYQNTKIVSAEDLIIPNETAPAYIQWMHSTGNTTCTASNDNGRKLLLQYVQRLHVNDNSTSTASNDNGKELL